MRTRPGARIASRLAIASSLALAALGIGATGAGASTLGIADFGPQATGTSVTKTMLLTNGCVTVIPLVGCAFAETTPVSPSVIGTDFSLAFNGCPPTLTTAGQQCPIGVTFAPTGVGARTGTLHANSNAAPKGILMGTGVLAPTSKGKKCKKAKKKSASAAKKKGCKKK